MGKKATVLATACVTILVIVFFQFYIFRTAIEQTPSHLSDVTFINGFPYSQEPTPHDRIRIYYYTLLNADSDSQMYPPAVSTSGSLGSEDLKGDWITVNPKIYNWTIISPGIYDGMLWHVERFWLLNSDEPAPPNAYVDNSPLFGPMPFPDPLEQVLINGWIYSQTATNFTKFTMPQLDRMFWAETANEPIPADAQVQH